MSLGSKHSVLSLLLEAATQRMMLGLRCGLVAMSNVSCYGVVFWEQDEEELFSIIMAFVASLSYKLLR